MGSAALYGLSGGFLLVAALVFFFRMRSLVLGSLFAGVGVMFISLALTARPAEEESADLEEDGDDVE